MWKEVWMRRRKKYFYSQVLLSSVAISATGALMRARRHLNSHLTLQNGGPSRAHHHYATTHEFPENMTQLQPASWIFISIRETHLMSTAFEQTGTVDSRHSRQSSDSIGLIELIGVSLWVRFNCLLFRRQSWRSLLIAIKRVSNQLD